MTWALSSIYDATTEMTFSKAHAGGGDTRIRGVSHKVVNVYHILLVVVPIGCLLESWIFAGNGQTRDRVDAVSTMEETLNTDLVFEC
jgi:hypothetical protein